jgi:thiamine-phosphate pyrophosphorylase
VPRQVLPSFYPILDVDFCRRRGTDPFELAAACLRGGARLLQLRAKSDSGADVLVLTGRLVALARPYGAAVIVNDRADLARMAGAAGVHVGQQDLAVDDVRRLLGPTAIVGVSAHDQAQVDAAARTSASYIAVGPVCETSTKETGYTARGLSLVRYAAKTGRPIVAIGGLTLENAPETYAAGATSIAVIGDLFSGDPEARTRAFLALAPAPPA